MQYTDPSLEYESTGWQVEYATALKLLNWKETKATLFPEAATLPLVAAWWLDATPSTSGRDSGSATGRRSRRRTSATRSSGGTTRSTNCAAAFLSDVTSVGDGGKYTLVINLKRPRPDFASIDGSFFQAIPSFCFTRTA